MKKLIWYTDPTFALRHYQNETVFVLWASGKETPWLCSLVGNIKEDQRWKFQRWDGDMKISSLERWPGARFVLWNDETARYFCVRTSRGVVFGTAHELWTEFRESRSAKLVFVEPKKSNVNGRELRSRRALQMLAAAGALSVIELPNPTTT